MNNIPTRDNLMARQNEAMKKIVIEKLEAMVNSTIKYVKIDGRIPQPLIDELIQKGYRVEYVTGTMDPSILYTHISWN